MDDWEVYCRAVSMAQNCQAWDCNHQLEPSEWDDENYALAACAAQAILCEQDELTYLRLRRAASQKRAANNLKSKNSLTHKRRK